MTGMIVLRDEASVLAALADERLVPPPGSGGSGPTVALRAAMARFSGPAERGARRAAVEEVLAALDPTSTARWAGERAAARLVRQLDPTGGVEVISSVARPCIVEAVALGLGVPAPLLDDVVRDVNTVVGVIGRGDSPGDEADAASERLHARFAAHRCGSVAVISALYQSMDATAALVATTLQRRLGGATSATCVPIGRTKRLAVDDVDIGATRIAAGTVVELELGRSGLWFGAGRHACPGRTLAEAIAEAIVAAVDRSGATVDLDRGAIEPDGRPSALWCVRR